MQRILKAYAQQEKRLQRQLFESAPTNDGNNNSGLDPNAINEIVSAIDDEDEESPAKKMKLSTSKCSVPVRKQPARSSKQTHPYGCQKSD